MGEAELGRIEQRAGPEVVDDEGAVLMGELREPPSIRPLDEAGLPEVRRVDAEDRANAARRQRLREVGDACPVRRADLDEVSAGTSKDLGDPDAAADLDELAPGDGDPTAAPDEADRERNRRGVVVHDECVVRAGERDEVLLGRPDPLASPPSGGIELEEDVATRGQGGGLDRDGGPRRPAEVGVDDHAGRVEDARDGWDRQPGEPCEQLGREPLDAAGRPTSRKARTLDREQVTGRGDERRVIVLHPVELHPHRGEQALHARRMGSRCRSGHRRSNAPGCSRTLADVGAWRERMGVEPTASRRAWRHRF